MARNYLEWQNATTPEQKSLSSELIASRVDDLSKSVGDSDSAKVQKIMEKKCPNDVETFEQFMAGELTLDEE